MARLQLARRNLARVSPPAAPAWDVASLFDGGLFGEVWVSAPAYLYELTSDVTPNVADTDPIGKIVGMVNGIEWPAAGTSNKPTYDESERAMRFLGGSTLKYLRHSAEALQAAFDNADHAGMVIVSKSAGPETSSPGSRNTLYMADPSISFNLSPDSFSPNRAAGSTNSNIGVSSPGSDYISAATGLASTEYRVTSVNLSSNRVTKLAVNGSILVAGTNTSPGGVTKRKLSLLGSGSQDMYVRGVIVRNAPFTDEELANISTWGLAL